ncbi:predicted protein [Naegleria gruberi]|uniref:Predicted protein n=1 Tax=Naegleria gruberi TaxID=5762 RepID=D2V6U1_NAEGR|nr:uncharacterized protein NAEGRDRAFT_47128 [Naegleria gruberi]EFC47504.1 predicted protein [Naegleria gruberi]|eukprot:XP_002680248.1 predicted protein [Naegleria gruberi strain NEG-M]
MGFFSNLFHHHNKNDPKHQSVSVSSTAPSLTSPHTIDETSHADQALDQSFRSTVSSTHINSNTSSSRLSIDSMASSFSNATQYNSTHKHSMSNPFHFLHTHTSHHNPQRMSVRDFARQYLEVLESEKRRELLKSVSMIQTNYSNGGCVSANQSLHAIVGGAAAATVVGDNVNSNNENLVSEEATVSNGIAEVNTESTTLVTAVDNSNTSNEDVAVSNENNRLSIENSQLIRNIKKQHVNNEEKQTFKKFIIENEKYIQTLDEIYQVCIYGQVERLKELVSAHSEKSGRKFSLTMASLRMTGSVIDMSGDAEHKNVKKQSWSHCTLVHLAARFNQVDVLDMLLKEFTNEDNLSDVLNCEDDIHATPLFHAVTAGAIEATTFLCSFTQQIKINVKDMFECSPLWYALNRKDFEMANILLTFGADMFFKIHGGESYLHRACDNNDIAMVKYILLGIGVDDEIDLTNQKTLQIFEERQNLFLRSDQRHQTPLFNSIKSYQDNMKKRKSDTLPSPNEAPNPQKEQVMDFLLSFFNEHAPVLLQKALDQTNHYGHNVFHFCAEQDAFQQLLKLIKYFETDEKLKFALNLKDKILGNTPLHISIMTSHYDIFKLFINCSEVELNIPNQQLDLPLHVALRQHKLRMCQYLYIHYSQQDLEVKNAQRYSSLKLAKRLDINMKKLAEGSTEEFEKKKIVKNTSEKKWWHIFKIHKQNNQQDSRKSMVEKGHTTPLEEISQNESEFTSSTDASSSDLSAQRTTFPLVIWTKELTLGVDIIDTQHHALVDIINKLIKLLFGEDNAFIPDRSADEWILGYIIGNLLEYTEFHFETEEKIMSKYQKILPDGYLDEHHQEHVEFTSKIHKLHQEYLESHSTLSFLNVDLLNYLLNWLVTHIMGSDHILVSHLNKGMKEGQKIEL